MRVTALRRYAARTILCLTLVLSAVLNSGCSLNFSANDMLSPPKLTEEQTAIYNALTESAGRVDLRYPKMGSYRSAFVIKNLDDEYSNEAIVFYESALDFDAGNAADVGLSKLRICFLDKDSEGKWHSVYEIPAEGTDVDSVSFSDLGSNKTRVIISFSILNSSDKIVSVIDYGSGIAKTLYKVSCSSFLISEFTRKGAEDLLCFGRDKETKTAVFSAFGCNSKGDFERLYNSVQLKNEISEFGRITIGKCMSLNEKTNCIAIDYLKSENVYGTEMIYFTGNSIDTAETFIRDNGGQDAYIRRTNSFTPIIYSGDVNNDGIIDIPVTKSLPGYENLTFPEQVNAVLWYKQDSQLIEKTAYTFIDPNKNYMLFFPGRWEGMVTATVDLSQNTVTFWKTAEDITKVDFPVLTIRVVIKNEDTTGTKRENTEKEGFKIYSEDEEKIVYVKNVIAEGLALTQDELKAALSVRWIGFEEPYR